MCGERQTGPLVTTRHGRLCGAAEFSLRKKRENKNLQNSNFATTKRDFGLTNQLEFVLQPATVEADGCDGIGHGQTPPILLPFGSHARSTIGSEEKIYRYH